MEGGVHPSVAAVVSELEEAGFFDKIKTRLAADLRGDVRALGPKSLWAPFLPWVFPPSE